MNQKVTWLTYDFDVYLKEGNWNDVGGIYIFVGTNPMNLLLFPIYVGKAESFKVRLPNHDRWAEAVRFGATHVHAMVVPQEANRQLIEAELIQCFQPPLNVQLKTGLPGLGAVGLPGLSRK